MIARTAELFDTVHEVMMTVPALPMFKPPPFCDRERLIEMI